MTIDRMKQRLQSMTGEYEEVSRAILNEVPSDSDQDRLMSLVLQSKHQFLRSKIDWLETSIREAQIGEIDGLYELTITRAGFPFRSLEGAIGSQILPPPSRLPTVEIGTIPITSDRALVVRPIWHGVALNSVAYSALAFIVIRVLLRIRDRTYMKSGRCLQCGYQVSLNNRCPECGTIR
jgi:predicted Zn-ribbon and HTH transcriptional regulator